jgi:hypothetical protein
MSEQQTVGNALMHLERAFANNRAYNEAQMVKQISGVMEAMQEQINTLSERCQTLETQVKRDSLNDVIWDDGDNAEEEDDEDDIMAMPQPVRAANND